MGDLNSSTAFTESTPNRTREIGFRRLGAHFRQSHKGSLRLVRTGRETSSPGAEARNQPSCSFKSQAERLSRLPIPWRLHTKTNSLTTHRRRSISVFGANGVQMAGEIHRRIFVWVTESLCSWEARTGSITSRCRIWTYIGRSPVNCAIKRMVCLPERKSPASACRRSKRRRKTPLRSTHLDAESADLGVNCVPRK